MDCQGISETKRYTGRCRYRARIDPSRFGRHARANVALDCGRPAGSWPTRTACNRRVRDPAELIDRRGYFFSWGAFCAYGRISPNKTMRSDNEDGIPRGTIDESKSKNCGVCCAGQGGIALPSSQNSLKLVNIKRIISFINIFYLYRYLVLDNQSFL